MDLFCELDKDGSKQVSPDEWERFTRRPDAKATLALIGLDVTKSSEVFRLIDLDDDGHLGLEEFVVGAMQLCGEAKMVDVETLLRNNKKIVSKITGRLDRLELRILAA